MGLQREFNWPINPVTVNSGPLEYETNGASTVVNIDTVTPSNSTPLPVIQYGASGLPADYATAANQVLEIADLDTIKTNTTGISLEATQLLVKSDLDTIATNTTGLATEVTAAASKSDLDTIVTNTTGLATQTTLAALNTKVPSQGQALMAASVPVAIASDQSAIPTTVASLPLPSGAATSALQTTGNTSLSTIATNTTGVATAANQATAQTSFNSIVTSTGDLDTNLGAKADTAATTDTGAFSVIAFIKRGLQNWTSLLAKIPALGQALMASSIPVAIASNQSAIPVTPAVNVNGSTVLQATSTVATITKPANAVGFIVQNDGTAATPDWIRFAIGVAASSTVGMLLQPGQDSGYIPASVNISVIANSGTQNVQVVWVLSA